MLQVSDQSAIRWWRAEMLQDFSISSQTSQAWGTRAFQLAKINMNLLHSLKWKRARYQASSRGWGQCKARNLALSHRLPQWEGPSSNTDQVRDYCMRNSEHRRPPNTGQNQDWACSTVIGNRRYLKRIALFLALWRQERCLRSCEAAS